MGVASHMARNRGALNRRRANRIFRQGGSGPSIAQHRPLASRKLDWGSHKLMEDWIEKKTIYQGTIFNVYAGPARLDNGAIVHRETVEHGGGVGIVPVVAGHVILVRQYRIACGKDVLEIPAGRLEPGENPEWRARRELEEETGYLADTLVLAARCHCSPGFTNELDYVFLGFGLTPTEPKPEAEERIELVRIPLDELGWRLDACEFEDAKTVIGLRELLARGKPGEA